MPRARSESPDVARSFLDERTIDLEDVDGQVLQVGERGVAGPEVVHREAEAQLLQLPQARNHRARIDHDQALGDFEDEPARRQARALQGRAHLGHEIRLLELARREVHADVGRRTGPGEGRHAPAGLFDDPEPDAAR